MSSMGHPASTDLYQPFVVLYRKSLPRYLIRTQACILLYLTACRPCAAGLQGAEECLEKSETGKHLWFDSNTFKSVTPYSRCYCANLCV